MSIDANGFIQLPSAVNKLSIGYKILYGLLNFEFFNIESLSFCLWKQATVLDILAFKYITTIFAFGLVMCLVFITHYCQCKNLCVLKKKFSARDSVIHGLSTFLVMCYAQCTKISFQILTSVTLTGQGGTPGPGFRIWWYTVLSGEAPFVCYSSLHLSYDHRGHSSCVAPCIPSLFTVTVSLWAQ